MVQVILHSPVKMDRGKLYITNASQIKLTREEKNYFLRQEKAKNV